MLKMRNGTNSLLIFSTIHLVGINVWWRNIRTYVFLAKLCSMVQTVIFYFVIGKGLVTYNKDKN